MNLNIYINDKLAIELDAIAASSHKKRNTLIQEAISLLVKSYKIDKWSDKILKFKGINDLKEWKGFEQHRKELKEPNTDIFKDL